MLRNTAYILIATATLILTSTAAFGQVQLDPGPLTGTANVKLLGKSGPYKPTADKTEIAQTRKPHDKIDDQPRRSEEKDASSELTSLVKKVLASR